MKSNAIFIKVAVVTVLLAGLLLMWVYKSTQNAYNNPLNTPLDFNSGQPGPSGKAGQAQFNPEDLSTLPFPFNTRWLEKMPGSHTAALFKPEVVQTSHVVTFTATGGLPFSSPEELRSLVSEMVPAMPVEKPSTEKPPSEMTPIENK